MERAFLPKLRLFSVFFGLISSLMVLVSPAEAQIGGIGGFGRSVGGVMVDAEGALRAATLDEKNELGKALGEIMQMPQGDLAQAAELRAVSLNGLQAAMVHAKASGKPFPQEIEFLAGLQRIQYVFVDADHHDIVIAGPAEPWELRADGSVVGKISGQPTLRLEDLMVAIQSVETARSGGISCSIEPTDEGRLKLQRLLKGFKLQPGQNPASLEPAMREAFGPQQVLLTGIPSDSRYARTMVAADFEMKRIAMQLVDSAVDGLPSYLQLSKGASYGGAQNPRWWMACNYDALLCNEDKTAWKISGQGIKTLTEQEMVNADGSVTETGKVDKLAQKWADLMTEKFSELSREMPVFGDLRNTIDMSIVATLIVQERLAEKAGIDLAVLAGREGEIELVSYPTPKTIEPQCSFVRAGRGWTVTASGGVTINPFEVVANQSTATSVTDTRAAVLDRGETTRWWWNG
jgi:Protein of unknown function (DUF1598)